MIYLIGSCDGPTCARMKGILAVPSIVTDKTLETQSTNGPNA